MPSTFLFAFAGTSIVGRVAIRHALNLAVERPEANTSVFYLAFLPQFIAPTEPVLAKSLLLASIHFVEAIVWLVALSMLLDQARRYLLKPAVRRGLEGLCAGRCLVGFGARLALARP